MSTLNTIMGKGWKQRNHPRQAEFDAQPFYERENEWNEGGSTRSWPREHHLGEYAVTGRDRTPCDPQIVKKMKSRDLDQDCQLRSCPRQSKHTQSAFVPGSPQNFDQASFGTRPSLFKEYLIGSFHHILCQIQRWYPEEINSANDDKMDWQPEREIRLPAPADVEDTYDPTPWKNWEVRHESGLQR